MTQDAAGQVADLKRMQSELDATTETMRALDKQLDRALYELTLAQGRAEMTVPDGWQLVPIEPTPEMVGAWYAAYRAMLAAAPVLQRDDSATDGWQLADDYPAKDGDWAQGYWSGKVVPIQYLDNTTAHHPWKGWAPAGSNGRVTWPAGTPTHIRPLSAAPFPPQTEGGTTISLEAAAVACDDALKQARRKTKSDYHDGMAAMAQALAAFFRATSTIPGCYQATLDASPALSPVKTDFNGHVYYKRGDKDAPEQIKDRNGDIALDCCRVCGRAEIELSVPCGSFVAAPPLTEGE